MEGESEGEMVMVMGDRKLEKNKQNRGKLYDRWD
jgi:hypothetical protein